MGPGGRIFAMTSSGGSRALPFYGSVSAAKAALESHIRQLAVELAPRGVTANAIRAGVTATPAAQKIPGYASLEAEARRRNPSGRLTTPEDVARAIVVLSHPDSAWVTGNDRGRRRRHRRVRDYLLAVVLGVVEADRVLPVSSTAHLYVQAVGGSTSASATGRPSPSSSSSARLAAAGVLASHRRCSAVFPRRGRRPHGAHPSVT
jgi:hypothetical protein